MNYLQVISQVTLRMSASIAISMLFAVSAYSAPTITEAEVSQYLEDNPNFLVDNPHLIQRTIAYSRGLENERLIAERLAIIKEAKPKLQFIDRSDTKSSQPKIEVIEFSDYQCIPCKKSHPYVRDFAINNNDVSVISLPLPIYGEISDFAAKASLAAYRQGKFSTFHDNMMALRGPLSYNIIIQTATQSGVNIPQMQKDITTPEVNHYLVMIKELAEQLGVRGTPTYVINGDITAGEVNAKKLHAIKKYIANNNP